MGQGTERNRGTFLVRILYRQNDSWQGEVLWAEQEKRRCFKSALELLRLIDGAMDQEEAGMGKTAWRDGGPEKDLRKPGTAMQNCRKSGWRR